MDENDIIISTNTKMSIKIFASNNRIIIKESFAKITKKSLFGHFLGYPPKMHYSALQCSAMY